MPCFHPLEGYRGTDGSWSSSMNNTTGMQMLVPCGRCIGCRLERSRQWAVRMMHEASLHDSNAFLTLTYSDANLPPYGSLDKRAVPRFMKRLRKKLSPHRIRYFQCGEYGDVSERPHYHVCLFGEDFADDRVHWRNVGSHRIYRSPLLESCWPFGQSEIGSLTFESAAYVARYITKKVTGKRAEQHYQRVNPMTGEIIQLEPEFATMSRRPGIGAGWLEKFADDVYPSDEVIVNGHPTKPPRYYDKLYEVEKPEMFDSLTKARRLSRDRENNSPERLSVREVCTKARVSLSTRDKV